MIIQIYIQYHKDINTIIYCYLIIRLILIFNLYKTNEFNVIKIYDMSRYIQSIEIELYDCSRIEIQVPSSYEKLFYQFYILISLFIFFQFFMYIYSILGQIKPSARKQATFWSDATYTFKIKVRVFCDFWIVHEKIIISYIQTYIQFLIIKKIFISEHIIINYYIVTNNIIINIFADIKPMIKIF